MQFQTAGRREPRVTKVFNRITVMPRRKIRNRHSRNGSPASCLQIFSNPLFFSSFCPLLRPSTYVLFRGNISAGDAEFLKITQARGHAVPSFPARLHASRIYYDTGMKNSWPFHERFTVVIRKIDGNGRINSSETPLRPGSIFWRIFSATLFDANCLRNDYGKFQAGRKYFFTAHGSVHPLCIDTVYNGARGGERN